MIYLLRPDGAKKPLRMQLPKSQVLVYHEKEEVYISLWEEALYFCSSNSGILEKELVEKCTIPYNK